MAQPLYRTLLLFVTLFLIACGTSSPGVQQDANVGAASACIERVIAMDDSLGTVRNHACEQISLSETIQQYVQSLEKVDFQNCPSAFTTAFQRHLEAWTQMITVTDHYPDLRGEMHDLFDIIEQGEYQAEFKPRLAAIWDTWSEVERAMGE
jgi:hypothetical protein